MHIIDVQLDDDEGNHAWIGAAISSLNEYARKVPGGLRFSVDPDGTLDGLFWGVNGVQGWPVLR